MVLAAAAAWAGDASGTWKGEINTPDGTVLQLTCTLKQEGAKLAGTISTPETGTIELANGKADGDKISFIVKVEMNGGTVYVSEGTIKGDEMTLDIKEEGAAQGFPTATLKREKQ